MVYAKKTERHLSGFLIFAIEETSNGNVTGAALKLVFHRQQMQRHIISDQCQEWSHAVCTCYGSR